MEQLLADYYRLFPYRLESSVRRPGAASWRPMSHYHFLTDDEIRSSLSDEVSVQRAVSLDENSRLAVIAIPSASIYHTKESVLALRRILWSCKIKSVSYEFQGQWFIYIYLNEALPAGRIHQKLHNLLAQKSFQLSSQTLQIHAFGSDEKQPPLPLPLQPGFIWLDEQCQPIMHRNSLCLADALQQFFADIAYATNDIQQIFQDSPLQQTSEQQKALPPAPSPTCPDQSSGQTTPCPTESQIPVTDTVPGEDTCPDSLPCKPPDGQNNFTRIPQISALKPAEQKLPGTESAGNRQLSLSIFENVHFASERSPPDTG